MRKREGNKSNLYFLQPQLSVCLSDPFDSSTPPLLFSFCHSILVHSLYMIKPSQQIPFPLKFTVAFNPYAFRIHLFLFYWFSILTVFNFSPYIVSSHFHITKWEEVQRVIFTSFFQTLISWNRLLFLSLLSSL